MRITFIEGAVVTIIAAMLGCFVYAFFNRDSADWNESMIYLNPEVSRAKSQFEMAEEQRRANELKEQELQIRREELRKGEKP